MRKDAVLEPLYTFDYATNDSDRVKDLYENDRKRAERRAQNGGAMQIDERKDNNSEEDLGERIQ